MARNLKVKKQINDAYKALKEKDVYKRQVPIQLAQTVITAKKYVI